MAKARSTLTRKQTERAERTAFLEALVPMLHRDLADLLEQKIERDLFHVASSGDAIDRAAQEIARDEAFVTDGRRNQLISLISLALTRSETGEHGTCVHCGEDVSTKRLNAARYAPLCIVCQDMADHGLLQDSELNKFGMPLNPLKSVGPLEIIQAFDAVEQSA